MTTTRRRAVVTVMLALVAATSIHLLAQPAPPPPVIGRWDLTVQGANGSFPSWLEVALSGNRTLVGRFVGQGGSARPIARVTYGADGTVKFSLPPQWDKGDADLQFEGNSWPTSCRARWWTPAARATSGAACGRRRCRRTTGNGWGQPVTLFDGTNMTAWKPLGPETNWQVVNAVLTSTKPGANLATVQTFTDFKLHIEFGTGKRATAASTCAAATRCRSTTAPARTRLAPHRRHLRVPVAQREMRPSRRANGRPTTSPCSGGTVSVT